MGARRWQQWRRRGGELPTLDGVRGAGFHHGPEPTNELASKRDSELRTTKKEKPRTGLYETKEEAVICTMKICVRKNQSSGEASPATKLRRKGPPPTTRRVCLFMCVCMCYLQGRSTPLVLFVMHLLFLCV